MRVGLIGQSYTSRSGAVADEETINLFQETRGASQSVAPARMYGGQATGGTASHYWTPGLKGFAALAGGLSPVRVTCWTGSRLFAVQVGILWEVFADGTSTGRGSVSDDGKPASIAYSGTQLLVVSGGRAYCFTLATDALLDVTSQLAGVPLRVEYDDVYAVIIFQNSDKAQISNFNDWATWPPLFVNQVEVFAENITSIIANHRELWVFGERHTQVYQDTGSAEIFDAIPGAFIETGSVGAFGPCRLDNSVFWVNEDERGGRMAWRSNGYVPQRISTYAVEIDLASYPTLVGLTTYSYQDGGHLFWVLYVPGSQWSWCYDVGEQAWHKRASWDAEFATWGPHKSWNHAYAFGQHLVGDWSSSNLYALSQNNFTDNGAMIRRLRRAPTVSDEMNWMYHSMLNLDFEMGNLTNVMPTDSPGYAGSLLQKVAGSGANTNPPNGVSWDNPTFVNSDQFASCGLILTTLHTSSATSTGTSGGGGVAWTTPENIDAAGVTYATVDLAAGGAQIDGSSGSIGNSANPSNQHPSDVFAILGNVPSTAATDATIYVQISGNITASQGGGLLTLNYSKDGGSTWTLAQQWNATFAQTTVSVPVSGITNLSSLKIQLVAACSCGPSGFSNVTLVVPLGGFYVIVAGSGQPTAQILAAAVTGLTIPAGRRIVGVELSINGEYITDPPTLLIGLNVGNIQHSATLTSSPVVYTVGGPSDLWGYDAWTASTFTSLVVNFYAASTGTTTVNLNGLTVKAYHVESSVSSDGLTVTHFGFAIPAATAVQGIAAIFRSYAFLSDPTAAPSITAQLLKAGVPVGLAQTLPVPISASNTSPQVFTLTFGGLNSLFGVAWNNSDFAASNFGVLFTAMATGGCTVYVGYVQMQLLTQPLSPNYTYTGPDPMLVDGDGNPRPPQAMVRWSDDRGRTWSNEHVVSLGFAGEYKTRAIIRRLGRSRYRVYEVSMTDPVPWVLVDAYLDVAE